jgi:hypothetical protein
VTDFDAGPFRSTFNIRRERHAGDATPGAPGRQSFWVAHATGRTSAAVDWKVRDGDYRVVVMNADGSRGVATRTKFGVDVPYLTGIGIGLLAGGILMAAGGMASVMVGVRRRPA